MDFIKPLQKYATWRNLLIGFALIIVFNVFLFPSGLEKMLAIAPNAAGPFDLEFSYNKDVAYQMLESYTDEGRDIYSKSTLIFDTLYPITYGITFTLLLVLILPLAFPGNTKYHFLTILPLTIVITDFIENAAIVSMLQKYPDKVDGIIPIASTFSSIKWSLVGILLAIIVFSVVKIVFSKSKNA